MNNPVYLHDCDACIFVGTYTFDKCYHQHQEPNDVYICKQGGLGWTMIWRYSDNGRDYMSTPIAILKENRRIVDMDGKEVDTSNACYHFLLADIEDRGLMNTPPTTTIQKKLEEIQLRYQDEEHLVLWFDIFEAASRYWEENPDDFCVQSFEGGETIVFGGLNRLIWSPFTGFQADRSYCSKKFLERYDKLGPNPGRRS
jgi:hypothetical protein